MLSRVPHCSRSEGWVCLLSGKDICARLTGCRSRQLASPMSHSGMADDPLSSLVDAVLFHNELEVTRLLRTVDPSEADATGWTQLLTASEVTLSKIKMLIEAGADVNAVDSDGFTPLMSAAGAVQRSPGSSFSMEPTWITPTSTDAQHCRGR